MSIQELSDAIAKAEKATQRVPDPLRPLAFQAILQELLQRGRAAAPTAVEKEPTPRRSPASASGSGTTARVLALADEGAFAEQRSLSEIRQILAERGFHYTLEELGTPLTRLVRQKRLRRIRSGEGGKKVWRYSNY
jgi:hypothetical protein